MCVPQKEGESVCEKRARERQREEREGVKGGERENE